MQVEITALETRKKTYSKISSGDIIQIEKDYYMVNCRLVVVNLRPIT